MTRNGQNSRPADPYMGHICGQQSFTLATWKKELSRMFEAEDNIYHCLWDGRSLLNYTPAFWASKDVHFCQNCKWARSKKILRPLFQPSRPPPLPSMRFSIQLVNMVWSPIVSWRFFILRFIKLINIAANYCWYLIPNTRKEQAAENIKSLPYYCPLIPFLNCEMAILGAPWRHTF